MLAAALDHAPVTNAEYRKCAAARACQPAAFEDPKSSANLITGKRETADAYRKVAGDDQPAIGVSWADAKNYCKFAGKRLPTGKEWDAAKPRSPVSEWLADARGKRRAVRGQSRAEEPQARAPWLGFRCVKD